MYHFKKGKHCINTEVRLFWTWKVRQTLWRFLRKTRGWGRGRGRGLNMCEVFHLRGRMRKRPSLHLSRHLITPTAFPSHLFFFFLPCCFIPIPRSLSPAVASVSHLPRLFIPLCPACLSAAKTFYSSVRSLPCSLLLLRRENVWKQLLRDRLRLNTQRRK